MKEARRGMFGYELQGLEHSDPGFFGWKIWKLELDLSEGLGVGLGLTVELVVVTVLARSVLPNAARKVLELVGIWSIELALGIDASQGSTAPTVLLVVPEMAEGCLMVCLGLVVDCWNPDKGNKVSVKVFIKGLERGQGSGSCWHPRIPWLCSAMGQGGSCDLGHWLPGRIPSKTSRYWHRCDEGALGT